MATKESRNPADVLRKLATNGLTPHPAWLVPVRKAGADRFTSLGFPTLAQEDWRFTNIEPLNDLDLHPALTGSVTAEMVKRSTFGSLAAHRLVFVNGRFAEQYSSGPSLP